MPLVALATVFQVQVLGINMVVRECGGVVTICLDRQGGIRSIGDHIHVGPEMLRGARAAHCPPGQYSVDDWTLWSER